MSSMSEKFLYVFDRDSADILFALDYILLKYDSSTNMYVFANKDSAPPLHGNVFYLSNTLSY